MSSFCSCITLNLPDWQQILRQINSDILGDSPQGHDTESVQQIQPRAKAVAFSRIVRFLDDKLSFNIKLCLLPALQINMLLYTFTESVVLFVVLRHGIVNDDVPKLGPALRVRPAVVYYK